MGMDATRTIAPCVPLPPTAERLAAFFLDLYHNLIIEGRFTLISSPTAEISRSGYYDFFMPPGPDAYDRMVSGPDMATGTVVGDWIWLPDAAQQNIVEQPATVLYDGHDLNVLLSTLPEAGAGTADLILFTWQGKALEHVADAVAIPALAAPTEHPPDNDGLWRPYREQPLPGHDDYRDDPRDGEPGYVPEECFRAHPLQMGFGTWACGGGTDHVVPPLTHVLHRHLGPDLLIASEWI